MDLDKYQEKARKTDLHTKVQANELDYYLLGLTSEAGEVAGRMKRVYRDQEGKISLIEKERIKKELGDVLWYLSAICDRFDFSLGEVAELNIKKLSNRMENNSLHGDDPDR
jgi:NTP pyrophosphatase (non-canonical NTP hydrolase)